MRDSAAIAETGTIAGALRIPRGFIEFAADESTNFHNPALQKDSEIVIVCAAGGMAALTGKTLSDMGYTNVKNVGGISDWIAAGGKTDSMSPRAHAQTQANMRRAMTGWLLAGIAVIALALAIDRAGPRRGKRFRRVQ